MQTITTIMTLSLLQYLFPSLLVQNVYTLLAYDEQGYPVDEEEWDEELEDDLEEDEELEDDLEEDEEDEEDEWE